MGGGGAMLEKRTGHREGHLTAGEEVRDFIMGHGRARRPHRALRPRRGAPRRQRALLSRPHRRIGLAEDAACAISMGLRGYLAAQSEADHYKREMKRGQEEIMAVPDTWYMDFSESSFMKHVSQIHGLQLES